MSQTRLILPGQQVAPPSGSVACEAKGEVVFIAIQYPGLGSLGAALDIDAARQVADRLHGEADRAAAVRFQRQSAEALGATG